jgi:hypothetical protein
MIAPTSSKMLIQLQLQFTLSCHSLKICFMKEFLSSDVPMSYFELDLHSV